MIKLKALLSESGQGIIAKDQILFHIEPPYDLDCQTFIDDKGYFYSIEEQGFEECNIDFENMNELVDYLVLAYNHWKEKNDKNKITVDDGVLLQNLQSPFIEIFIEDLQNELESKNYKNVLRVSKELLTNSHMNTIKSYEEQINIIRNTALESVKRESNKEIHHIFKNLSDISFKDDFIYNNSVSNISLLVPKIEMKKKEKLNLAK